MSVTTRPRPYPANAHAVALAPYAARVSFPEGYGRPVAAGIYPSGALVPAYVAVEECVFCGLPLTELGPEPLTGVVVATSPERLAEGEHWGVVALAGGPANEEFTHLRCLLDMAAVRSLTLTVGGTY